VSANIWKRRLAAPQQHQWFEAFESAPGEALDALLWRRFDLANVGVLDVDDLLSRWVLTVGNEEGFAGRVDSALASWIERNWGEDESGSPETLRGIWATVGRLLCAAYVPSNERYLDNAATALRERLLKQPGFAPLLYSPRGCDAFFNCVNAVGLYQLDNHLRDFWWQLAELPNGFPSRYATLALTGIRRMRVRHGGFRYDLGRALFIVAKSLSRLVRYGVTTDSLALDEFSYLYDRARSSFPSFEPAWAVLFQSTWRPEIKKECSEQITAYVEKELDRLRPLLRPQRNNDHRLVTTGPRIFQATWHISNDPKRIEQMLLHRERERFEAAEWLLREQRSYGLNTGNFTFLVRTLQKFSVAVRNTARDDRDLALAEKWVVEIIERDADDPRGWSLLVDILKRRDEWQGTTFRAWRLAWALTDRFPGDAYCRNGLAEVLKSQGRLNEAEEVYRQAVEDFPHDVVARTGLAEVLKSQGRLNEAEEVYRQAVEDFPHNLFVRTGLAYILGGNAVRNPAEADRFISEAEAHYKAALQNRPDRKSTLIAYCGLGWLSEKRGQLRDAEDWYSKATRQERNNPWAREGLARLKRRATEAAASSSPAPEEITLGIPDLIFEADSGAPAPTVSWEQYFDSETELAEHPYQTSGDVIPAERVTIRTVRVEAGGRQPPAMPWSIVGYRLRMARATFFRRSARWQESLPTEHRSMESSRLRAAARKLLSEVIALRPFDSRANAELFALDLEDEDFSKDATTTERILSAQKMPTAELLQVAASAARIISRRESFSLHDAALREEVFRPVQALRAFDPAAKPLCELGESLAALAMVDSTERLQLAAGSLEKLRLWVAPKAKRVQDALDTGAKRDLESIAPFDAWSHAVTQRFFKPCGITDSFAEGISLDQVRRVDAWLSETTNQRHVADMEYQFARLLTPAIEETLALA